MRGLILAAGRGRRMGSLTEEIPKCLATVSGRTLLSHQLSAFKEAGIDDLAIVRGHLQEKIDPPEVSFFYNPLWANSNMVRSLLCANDWLEKEECILSYSDIIYPSTVIQKLAQAKGDICLVYDPRWLNLWSMRFANPLDDAESFQVSSSGKLLDIGRKNVGLTEISGQFMGLFKLTREGYSKIKNFFSNFTDDAINKLDVTSLLQLLLKSGIEITATPIQDKWYEVDNIDDLNLYNRIYQENPAQFFHY